MGPYLALLVFGLSPGLILLSRELLEARQGACPGGSQSPGCPVPQVGSVSQPMLCPWVQSGTHSALGSGGSAAPAVVECLTEERARSPNRP